MAPTEFVAARSLVSGSMEVALYEADGETRVRGLFHTSRLFHTSIGANNFRILEWSGTADLEGDYVIRWTLSGDGYRQFPITIMPALLPGDANRDGRVDGEDFLIWQAGFSTQEGATWDDGDFNGDGRVDGEDFLIWQAHFGQIASSSAVTPEPTTVSLLGLIGLGLLARCRQGQHE